jgi:hypothetical protein
MLISKPLMKLLRKSLNNTDLSNRQVLEEMSFLNCLLLCAYRTNAGLTNLRYKNYLDERAE